MGIVTITTESLVPKYKQIVASIEEAISTGQIKKGDQLPSLNTITKQHGVSRDTVITAFNALKNRGIIDSVSGKGYFLCSEDIQVTKKIFLLFDELNAFKEDLYNAFINNLDENTQVEIFFHHFNPDTFRKLITDNMGNFSYYVIMPANLKATKSVIENLPSDRVYILDQRHADLEAYPTIFQNFEKDIRYGLQQLMTRIKRYKTLILIFEAFRQPQGLLNGFVDFCKTYKLPHQVIESVEGRIPAQGEVYLTPDDRSLSFLIKNIKDQDLELGHNVGIISYNETILKEIVEGGITTISTDFKKMGKTLAQMINTKEKNTIENQCHVFLRQSI